MEKAFSPSSGWVSEAPKPPDPLIQKAFKVYNFIVSKAGEIELSDLVKHPSPLQKFSESQALEWLKGFTDQTDSSHLEKPCFVLKAGPQGKINVRVWIRVKLCSSYEKSGYCTHGIACLQWHVCRGFLEGNCTKSELCSRSHNLFDEGNIQKAKKYILEKHNQENARKILAKNLPIVCEAYINKNCDDEKCSKLHLCPRFVQGICEKQEKLCSLGLSHALNSPKNKEVFWSFAVPVKYQLSHILLPKGIKLLELPEQFSGDGMSAIGKRKSKVENLNNLNADDERSQPSKLVNQNVPLNIREPATRDSKNTGKKKKEQVQKNGSSEPQEISTQKSKDKRTADTQRKHQSLMSLQFGEVMPLSVDTMFDPPCTFPRVDQQQPQNRQKGKKFSSQGARPKTTQPNMGNTRSQSDGVSSGEEDGNTAVESSSTKEDGRKRRQRKRGGRGGKNSETKESTLEKSLSLEGLSLNDKTTSDPNSHSKKGRTRRRGQQQKDQEPFSSDSIEQLNIKEEQESENGADLIEFGDEDLQIQEGKLIDLDDFDSDVGLSQMSETQSQAMWDLFSQDQLYSFDTSSLSQPVDLLGSLSMEDLDESGTQDQIKNASAKGVFNCIVREFGGTAKFSVISKHPDLWDPSFTDQENWFRSHRLSFLLVEDSKGNIEEVKAISLRARLCFKYNRGACNQENCQFFHVCKEYIAIGRCSNFGGSCKKSHGFKDPHNKALAERLCPGSNFTNKQVQKVIQSSTPQVCMDYNNYSCNRRRKCTKIHVCKNYGHKRCPKSKCKLAHENALKTPEAKALLDRFRIRIPPNMQLFMVARTHFLVCDNEVTRVDQDSKPSPDVLSKEKNKPESNRNDYQIRYSDIDHHICLAFLLGQRCKGNKCADHHCPLPYQWIYKTDKQWMMLDEKENTELEMSFCQNIDDQSVLISLKLDLSTAPSKLSHQNNIPYIYSVDLKRMEICLLDDDNIRFSLKRLCTESQVLAPECPLTTTWNWYWKNENDLYEEYQPCHGAKDPTSSTIEKFYQEGMSKYTFNFGNHDYQLYLNEMYQKNMDPQYYTKRDVMRRPQFLSPEKVNQLKRTCKLPTPDSRQIPHQWKKMAKSQNFLLKKLNSTSKEFKEIKTLFLNSMGDRQPVIDSINRVQNPFMWEKYQRKKDQMDKTADSQQVDERFLFHGTSYQNIRAICKENFDWRLYGKITGNIYGEGAYFARDASFSHCYCHDDDDGMRYVFVAKVLVGSFTEGEKNYRRPPLKDPSHPDSDYFDSCVDDVNSPKVFVVFDVDQYYPGYVIEYKCQPTDYSTSPSSYTPGLKASNSSNFPPYSPSQSNFGQSGYTPSSTIASSSSFNGSPYRPSQPSIGHSGSTLYQREAPTRRASSPSSSSPPYSVQPIGRSISIPAPDVTQTTHAYNTSPYNTSPNQPSIGQYVSMTAQSAANTMHATSLTSQRISEEIERFARTSKKSEESKQNCVVM